MKLSLVAFLLFILIQSTSVFSQDQPTATPAPTSDLEAVKNQLAQMQQSIEALQTQHQQEIAALKEQIANQQIVIDGLQKNAGSAAPPPATSEAQFPTTDESVVANAAPSGQPSPAAVSGSASLAFPVTDASVTAGPSIGTAPITIAGGGKAYLNISFDAMFAGAISSASDLDRIEVGDHDPQQRGFNARNNEIALDGAVDPYLEGFANIVFKLSNENETEVEVEEAFMQTTSLPYNLQFKGGQFFAPFGRLNAMHPHVWDFADMSLVNGRLLGSDGLRGVGVQLSWVPPLPWYSQVILAVQNGQGGTAYSFRNTGEDGTFFERETIDRRIGSLEDLVFVPRVETSFDLGGNQTVLLGASGAFGQNDTGSSTGTQIYGLDAFYKWKPANAAGGWPFVKWQSEAMYRRFEAGRGLDDSFPVSETFHDWGAYSQVVWGFLNGWTAGIRGDYLHMEDSAYTDSLERQSRWRLSADLTYYPSEFSKFRLQYNHDFLEANHFLDDEDVDSVFLQFEFALGAHGAHKF